MMHHAIVVVVVLLVSAPLAVHSQSLVIIGGGLSETNTEVYGRFLELAGGASNARIGIVTASSADPQDSADYYKDVFENRYGVLETYWIPVHLNNKEANSDPVVVDNTLRMTGFFFGGGSQIRIIDSFYNDGEVSPVLAALRSVYEGGAVVGGSSAGAAAMPSAPMIMGGTSYNALRYGAFPAGEEGGGSDLIYNPTGGLGLLDNYIVDSHVGERGREGRLARLVWDTRQTARGVQYGIGVDENTALVVTNAIQPNAVGQVYGRWGVIVVDLSDAEETSSDPLFLYDIRAHYLTHGDTIHMTSHQITFDSWKSDLAGDEMYDTALTSDDIFAGTGSGQTTAEFAAVSRSVFDSRLATTTHGRTRENNPKYEVFFEQGFASRGFGGYSPLTGEWEISYDALWVDMYHCPQPCSRHARPRPTRRG